MSISKAAKQAYDKEYRLKNLHKRRAQQRAWNADAKNKEHKRQYDLEYRKKNRLQLSAKHLAKKKSCIQTRLRHALRNRLGHAIKNGSKSGSAVRDLGCSIEFLKTYLESKFQPGMTWENWGKEDGCWHIDHIVPLSWFDLTAREQLLNAVHYTNLQPLWAEENSQKGARVA